MNMINRWQMELAKMIVVVGCVCCTCQLASAYQLQVFALGSDLLENATAELLPFDESGAQLTRFGIPESGLQTTSFATDGESFFVAASRSGINRYDLQGNFLGEFADVSGSNSSPQRLESDLSGNLYVTFSSGPTSYRLDPSGAVSATFSRPDLNQMDGIDAAANGDVFILGGVRFGDTNRLFQFNASGVFINEFTLPQVSDASDIAINEITNELFVTDYTEDSVFIYDLSSGAPVLLDTLPTPFAPLLQDVFVEPFSNRIFVTTTLIELENGIFRYSVGFELSRAGDIVNTFSEDAPLRDQNVDQIVAIPVPSPTLVGDVNLDGVVDFSDIPAFISVLQDGTFQIEADTDQNLGVDFADIPSFIEILAGN